MIRRILILGASYGSLFGTKLLMAVHDVTLVCRRGTADLINMNGTEVCLPLKDEKVPRRIRSSELSGRLDAKTPEMIDPSDYDLVVLAMQEPHYLHHAVRALLKKKPLLEVGDALYLGIDSSRPYQVSRLISPAMDAFSAHRLRPAEIDDFTTAQLEPVAEPVRRDQREHS